MRVALAGCSTIDDPDEPLLVGALDRVGVAATGLPWDAETDWSSYDLVVVRSTWDYVERRDEFLAWADAVPRLANPASVLGWNTDKRYLAELAAAGVPVVPTTYVTGTFAPPPGEYVVKPTVSAAGLDTTRYGPGQEAAARSHVARLRAAGRGVIVQPYVHAIEEQHETSLLYLGGDFSHGARKGPLLAGTTVGATDSTDRAGAQAMAAGPRAPSPEERDLAEAVLAAVAVAVPSPLLYARVDLVPGPDGPQLLEVELTEPFLFLGTSEGAADRLATAIADWPS